MAWMSAGRAFRMVQLMRLHEVDGGAQNPFLDQHDLTERKSAVEHFGWRICWTTCLPSAAIGQ